MATQSPQSLPSFAQTFGTGPSSYNRLSEMNNSLPPIQRRPSPYDRSRRSPALSSTPQPSIEPKQNSRKRLHAESSAADDDENTPSDSGRRSPLPVTVKEEADYDAVPSTSQPRQPPAGQSRSSEPNTNSPPTDSPNPSKKRRVTVSGLAPPINTDVRRPSVDSGISPVVMGIAIMRDDPAALEQVRSMITVKQKQKALIEQRRGSTAGIVTPIPPPSVNVVNPRPGSEEIQPPPRTSGRAGGRSPNITSSRRRSVVSSTGPPPNLSSNSRPLSPVPIVLTQQQQQPPPPLSRPPLDNHSASSIPTPVSAPSHLHPSSSGGPLSGSLPPPLPPSSSTLPPPSAGFGRRRAGRELGGGKAKPADIMISTQGTSSHMAPSIHSAPPIPRAGQQPGRFPMAIPTLPPSIMAPGQPPKRLASGQVPPTPTRLTLGRHGALNHLGGGVPGRSPSTASIPIATTLVPPTPSSLHHPGYSGEKSAFLAPFEMFYDALSDSKELKKWLAEQLQKSSALITTLQKQHEQIEETISSIVDKKVSVMREEVYNLRVRVDELEQALRVTKATGSSPGMSAARLKGKPNGLSPNAGGTVFETYTFPPVDPLPRRPEPVHRAPSPAEVDPHSVPGSSTSSPVPFDMGKRLSVSAMRLDPPPRGPAAGERGPSFRDTATPYVSHPSTSGSGARVDGWSPRSTAARPPPNHQGSAAKTGFPPSSSSSSQQHGHRYSIAVDRHQYADGTVNVDRKGGGEGRLERDVDSHPASQRRNSIDVPTSGSSSSPHRGERTGRAKSPMDAS